MRTPLPFGAKPGPRGFSDGAYHEAKFNTLLNGWIDVLLISCSESNAAYRGADPVD